VSRQHFQIERSGSGEFFVRDRRSTCGTLAGDLRLAAGAAEICALFPGNTILAGTPQSRFVFQFEIKEKTRRAVADQRLEFASAREKARLAWKLGPGERDGI
jgi:hypothetical protein